MSKTVPQRGHKRTAQRRRRSPDLPHRVYRLRTSRDEVSGVRDADGIGRIVVGSVGHYSGDDLGEVCEVSSRKGETAHRSAVLSL